MEPVQKKAKQTTIDAFITKRPTRDISIHELTDDEPDTDASSESDGGVDKCSTAAAADDDDDGDGLPRLELPEEEQKKKHRPRRRAFNVERAKISFPWVGRLPASANGPDEAVICEWCRESATAAERQDHWLRFWIEGVVTFKNMHGKKGKLAKHHDSALHKTIATRRAMDEQSREIGSLEQQLVRRAIPESEKQFNRRQLEKLTYLLLRAVHLDLAHSDCLRGAADFQVACMGDVELAKFTKPGVRTNSSYTSKETTALLLRELSSAIERPTIDAIKASPFSVIQADGTTDSAGLQQFVIAMRYWHDHQVHEKYCSLRSVTAGTAEYLEKILCEFFDSKGIDMLKLIFQVYDGCNTNKGAKGGLQVRIRRRAKLALFVWCRAHLLQLAVCDSVKNVPELEMLFALTDKIWTYYRKSFVQWANLKAMSREYHLHLMALHKAGETRWTSHTAAVRSIIIDYNAIVCHLAIKPKKDFKAAGMLCELKKPSTRVMLVFVLNVFELLEYFQRKMMRDESNFLSYKDDVDQLLVDLDELGNDASIERLARHEIVREVTVNSPAESDSALVSVPPRAGASAEEVREIVDDILPYIIDFAETRLKGEQAPVIQALAIYAPKVLVCTRDCDVELRVLFDFYGEAVNAADFGKLQREFKVFRETFRNGRKLNSELTLSEFMKCDRHLSELTPAAYLLAIVALMCPISSVFSERVFSKLKLIKTYLRGRLSGESLDSLLRVKLHVNQLDMTRWCDLVGPAVDEYIRNRPHRLDFAIRS